MEKRKLGRTGIEVTVLSFGCGAVGGLMTKGDPQDQERAVARGLEMGITYFDTAPQYGNGTSEENLGRILKKLKPNIAVGTKVRVMAADRARIGETITKSLETSLKRLGRDHVDLLQLHNTIASKPADDQLDADRVLNEVLPAFERLKAQGKTRFFGITALGETPLLHRLVDSGKFDTAQVCYNALVPSAGAPLPKGYPAHDYGLLLERTRKAGMGTIGIRVLAAGALSGIEARHPLNAQDVAPIGSGANYKADVARAQQLMPMIREGHASSLTELAMRFAISHPALSTTLVGLANLEQLEAAFQAVSKGPLSPAALARLSELHKEFVAAA